jgi:uncharacterized membrane protein YbhN (UPF0104 family)
MHETSRSGEATRPDGGDGVAVSDLVGPSADSSPGPATPGRASPRRRRGRPWRAIIFAPVGDGRTRRRGSDAVRLGLAVLIVVLCWVMTRANSSAEQAVASTMASTPEGIRWVVNAIWWSASIGLIAITGVLALVSRRWSVVRDIGLSGLGAWIVSLALASVLGSSGGRPPTSSLAQFDATFPVALVAATVGVAVAAFPYLSRWLQLSFEVAIGLLAVATVVHGSGFPVAVMASLGAGWGTAALVRLIFGSPLGLPSTGEVGALLSDLDIAIENIAPNPVQGWGVGRFFGRLGTSRIDVSVYGRDASDAQLLAKTSRFIFYRDSGPTLALTRRQQVEHEAYLALMAERAGARVPEVLAAGPAGPARDAILVTRPPVGVPLADFAPYVPPPEEADGGGDGGQEARCAPSPAGDRGNGRRAVVGPSDSPVLAEGALDSVFGQLQTLRAAGIAHGSLSTHTIVVDERGQAGFVDFRSGSTVATDDQLNRDLAAAMAAIATVVGPERTVASVRRALPSEALVASLPYLQRAALDTVASKSLRGKKTILSELREQGAAAAGVEVPKLIEPRRVSWVTLAMVLGTLIGGWALIGVLINVTKSWDTIAGADWAWVALVFLLAQAAYPAIALTTVGSVTDPLPYGRTVALEVADTFVALAGGSMAVLATRIRFFQQEGYTPTVAVSSGVLASTASWIVKGVVFLIALPLAIGKLDLGEPASDSSGNSHLVWLIVIAVALAGVALGLVFAVPRWRRMAAQKIRPKASEVWSHLKLLAGHPRNLVEIFGGSLAAQLFVAMALGASLHAFGDRLSLATLIVVLTLGSMLGGVSPVPGGMGVVEAGMIIGLTAAGINESDAVAAVFVQRLFTAYLPPIWGWFVMVWMRRKEYL